MDNIVLAGLLFFIQYSIEQEPIEDRYPLYLTTVVIAGLYIGSFFFKVTY